MTPKEMINAITDIALAEKEKGNDLFFEYCPHIQGIMTHYHPGGWKEDIESECLFFYFENPGYNNCTAEQFLKNIIL